MKLRKQVFRFSCHRIDVRLNLYAAKSLRHGLDTRSTKCLEECNAIRRHACGFKRVIMLAFQYKRMPMRTDNSAEDVRFCSSKSCKGLRHIDTLRVHSSSTWSYLLGRFLCIFTAGISQLFEGYVTYGKPYGCRAELNCRTELYLFSHGQKQVLKVSGLHVPLADCVCTEFPNLRKLCLSLHNSPDSCSKFILHKFKAQALNSQYGIPFLIRPLQ